MQRRRIVAATVAVVAVGAVAGGVAAGAAVMSDDDGDEVPITGAALERASKVALAHTGGGRVTATEQGDEDSYYEVEVTLDDGSEIDVQLDENFVVVGDEPETGDEDDG